MPTWKQNRLYLGIAGNRESIQSNFSLCKMNIFFLFLLAWPYFNVYALFCYVTNSRASQKKLENKEKQRLVGLILVLSNPMYGMTVV
jgi:hypothetical protein